MPLQPSHQPFPNPQLFLKPHIHLLLFSSHTSAQSRNLVHAFFHLHCVHHWSRLSMPYTLRHLRTSLRGLRWGPEDFRGDMDSMCDLGDWAWCCCRRSCGVNLDTRWGGDTWKRRKNYLANDQGDGDKCSNSWTVTKHQLNKHRQIWMFAVEKGFSTFT